MNRLARKKIVFVIVEGPSDDIALGIGLNQIYDEHSVYIHITHGDITTRSDINPRNIVSRIGDILKQYMTSNHYKNSDFREIIHIVDTDAVYLPDQAVIYDANADSPIYEDDGIHTANVNGIIARNDIKRQNLLHLRSTNTIRQIPYHVYYMSANLDHVLYDKRNSDDEDKENDSYAFARRYQDDPDGFAEFICCSEFSVRGNYKDTWKFIESGMNSINRHCNLGVCIESEWNK